MTGSIIPADQWPEGAVALVWSAFGFGKWIVVDGDAGTWEVERADIHLPDGWDWRVPVMRQPAIDLEQFRDVVEFWISETEKLRDTGPKRGLETYGNRLLALIDGRARQHPDDVADAARYRKLKAQPNRWMLEFMQSDRPHGETLDEALDMLPTKGEGSPP